MDKQQNRQVVMRLEPSKELSEILGFPYFIEKKVPLQELLDNNIISHIDVDLMELGIEIPVRMEVKDG